MSTLCDSAVLLVYHTELSRFQAQASEQDLQRTWVTNFAEGILRFGVFSCAMCKYRKVPHQYVG